MTPILDQFRALLRERDEEFGVLDDDDDDNDEIVVVPPATTEEIVRLYEIVLGELTFNSKPIITDLTIIAGEQREHGEGIADAICARIIEVPVDQKLPSLYLLDSIVKNIGREYVRHFCSRLPEVFCEAYRQVHPNLHPSMRHLFGTWSAVFPSSVLRKIEAQLQFSPPLNRQSSSLTPSRASESPRPSHGIHVNPKYLEARRQFDSTADSNSQHPTRISSSLKMLGKPTILYDEYDSDNNTEVIPSQVADPRLRSTAFIGRTSFPLEAEKLLPSSTMIARSSPPFGSGLPRPSSPSLDGFAMDESPNRVVERASPSHSGFGYDYRRLHLPNDTHSQFSNGLELQRPRALIDAYGTEKGKRTINHKNPLKVEKYDVHGIDSKVTMPTWQNTEEEEFDWEDMSPTLLPSSNPVHGSFRTRPGFGTQRSTHLETDFRRDHWSNQAHLPGLNGSSSVVLEDAVPSSSGRGLINNINGFRQTSQFPGPRSPQESWNFPRNLPQSPQHLFDAKRSERNFQIPPYLATSSAIEQKPPFIESFRNADSQFRGPPNIAPKTISSIIDSPNPDFSSVASLAPSGAWPPPNMHNRSHPLSSLSTLPLQRQSMSPFDSMNPSISVVDQGSNKSFYQVDSIENRAPSNLPRFPHQQGGSISLNQQSQAQIPFVQPQFRQNLTPPLGASTQSHMLPPPSNPGYVPLGHGSSTTTVRLNPVPSPQSSTPLLNVPNTSLHLPGGGLPPLPPGPPPSSSQTTPNSQNLGLVNPNPPPGGALSGLISSLVAQGLISLTNQAPVQDSVGLEFNPDLLKVRHESAITALYADLPRQCTTCGLRFKCQEEHSSHMDWHVTKNRISRNRKQKPSRKWFVSVNMWLSSAEALGVDAGPGFLPAENVVEKKDDEEMAVPADEDQNVCALCGEPFDDFYSDETEEWMYKGAVYMNAQSGSIAGMDRSQLGPIVHAKCRSESSAVSPEDFGKNGGGFTEEGSQRKRMRS